MPMITLFLGHGPCSHLWEHYLKEAQPDVDYHHEDTSIAMLDHLLDSNGLREKLLRLAGLDDQDVVFIKEMIVGPLHPETGLPDSSVDVNGLDWPYRGREERKSFLYEIVANKISGKNINSSAMLQNICRSFVTQASMLTSGTTSSATTTT